MCRMEFCSALEMEAFPRRAGDVNPLMHRMIRRMRTTSGDSRPPLAVRIRSFAVKFTKFN